MMYTLISSKFSLFTVTSLGFAVVALSFTSIALDKAHRMLNVEPIHAEASLRTISTVSTVHVEKSSPSDFVAPDLTTAGKFDTAFVANFVGRFTPSREADEATNAANHIVKVKPTDVSHEDIKQLLFDVSSIAAAH